jgi:7-cyano-7-deazaguanine synthase in queuosine biosynthesis
VPEGSGVACLFSGGVDSFYTALKHREEITHLVFVHGFDIDLADSRRRAAAISTVREVAERMGKELVEVETNLRSFSDSHADWILYFGSAMASVALLLQRDFRRVFFAAGFAHSDWAQYPPPAGSHPGVDPLWSTEATEIVHAGAEATRLEKIQYLADQPLAMDHLLVCYQGAGAPYNCGRCGKCLRTMTSLRLAGGLERCRTLPDELDLDAVAALWDRSGSQPQFMEQNLRLARERDPELARALRSALEDHRLRWELERWHERVRLARARVRRTLRRGG